MSATTMERPRIAEVMAPALSQVAVRMFQETLAAALPCTWLRRAEQLERCRQSGADFTGRSDDDDRDARLAESAEACRERARFIMAYGNDVFDMVRDDVLTVMGEERIFTLEQAPDVVRAGQELVAESRRIVEALRGGL